MTAIDATSAEPSAAPIHFDVVVVGAGLSGVGAGYRLQTMCPGKSYAILEGRASLGGTWDLFRYPGIRSDSDMYTLGYPFRPWTEEKSIADGASILSYIEDTAREHGIDEHIRFSHRVVSANWDSATARWTVDAVVGDAGEPVTYTCDFLYFCSGYYRYDQGYQPDFPGRDRFAGPVIHPQAWPQDLDYTDKRVVVIGSGATAVTLVPSMASDAAHVTMLQRSPTWITSLPAKDPLAKVLRKVLPGHVAHRIMRWRNVIMTSAFYQLCRRRPKAAKRFLRLGLAAQLPKGYDLDPNFNPSYDPWDQRLCLVPDGDLFKAIKRGDADIVTDQIATFTETGVELASGRHLDADIIVSATGLQLVAVGGVSVTVDGEEVEPGAAYVYKGFMLSGVPNAAMCVGYTNASWTLRADISNQEVCRVINHLDRYGYASATPTVAGELEPAPLLDLTAGYIQRSQALMPKSGSKAPWKLRQNFILDLLSSKLTDVTEGLTFVRRSDLPAAPEVEDVPTGPEVELGGGALLDPAPTDAPEPAQR